MKNKIIIPKNLKKGSSIAIISPAGSVEETQLSATLDLIKNNGFKPVLAKNIFKNYEAGYSYAGTESQRTEDLNWALNDNQIDAIWASRGGYGSQHLVKNIRLDHFIKNPKWYIGYSDNTVINSYLLKNNIASISGQTIKTASFGVSEESYSLIFNILQGKLPNYLVQDHLLNKKGQAEGILIGGNLALVYALLGTNTSFKFKNKILFIEEIGEAYYALDRMLMSLEMAGVFRKIKGLIIGGMTNMGKQETNTEYENSFDSMANKIIHERIKKYSFPVLYNFPNGHIYHNLPLIIGAKVALIVENNSTIMYLKENGRT